MTLRSYASSVMAICCKRFAFHVRNSGWMWRFLISSHILYFLIFFVPRDAKYLLKSTYPRHSYKDSENRSPRAKSAGCWGSREARRVAARDPTSARAQIQALSVDTHRERELRRAVRGFENAGCACRPHAPPPPTPSSARLVPFLHGTSSRPPPRTVLRCPLVSLAGWLYLFALENNRLYLHSNLSNALSLWIDIHRDVYITRSYGECGARGDRGYRSHFRFHRNAPPETKTLEATEPRHHSTLRCEDRESILHTDFRIHMPPPQEKKTLGRYLKTLG